jgi:small subunit ribosomal protein S6
MATPMGFEPTISTVTGWHVRPLHHGAARRESVPISVILCQPHAVLFEDIPCAIIPKSFKSTIVFREDTSIAVKEKQTKAVTELLTTRVEPVRNYELVIIFRAEMTKEKIEAGIEHVTKIVTERGGTITSIEPWGKRKLAYPIKHQAEGVYNLIKFTAGSQTTKKLNADLRISEDVLRHLIVNPEA